jgi:hypothetical protein
VAAGTFGGRSYGASMSVPLYTETAGLFMILGVLMAFLLGRMDALIARIVGVRYTSGTSDGLRMRWIRVNGFLLLLFSALIFLNLSGRS